VLKEQPRPVRDDHPDIPAALSDLILRLMAKEPASRPATAADAGHALSEIR
jgi:hypothetical protein